MSGDSKQRDCRVCGGDGWTEGSAELRRDGKKGDTTCIACGGTGKEPLASGASKFRLLRGKAAKDRLDTEVVNIAASVTERRHAIHLSKMAAYHFLRTSDPTTAGNIPESYATLVVALHRIVALFSPFPDAASIHNDFLPEDVAFARQIVRDGALRVRRALHYKSEAELGASVVAFVGALCIADEILSAAHVDSPACTDAADDAFFAAMHSFSREALGAPKSGVLQ